MSKNSLVAAVAAVGLTVLSACSADVESTAADPAHSGHDTTGSHAQSEDRRDEAPDRGSRPPAEGKVIQPGRPGEGAQTLPPDTKLPASQYNDADAEFIQMMIPHHAQALEMGETATKRAQDPQVHAMAQRIADAQGAEVLSMSAWLQERGIRVPTAQDLEQHGAHGHTMQGMLSEAEMEQMSQARGERFDRLYLQGMIKHHQGAVDMAGQALDNGRDILVNEIASDIAVGQTGEIRRLRDLLRQL